MRKIQELSVAQIRLYRVGAIPWEILRSNRGRETISTGFSFEIPFGGVPDPAGVAQLPLFPDPLALTFINGEYEVGGERVYIRSLSIEPRRILLNVIGTSKQADAIYEVLVGALGKAAPTSEKKAPEVLYKAEETTCICELDFSFEQIFQPRVLRFLRENVTKQASNSTIEAKVEPDRFGAKIYFDLADSAIKNHGITLNPKDFIIQPRPGIPQSEHVYYTKSPLPSDSHLKLINQFETLFKKVS